MKIEQMDLLLKQSLKPGRYIHSVSTMKEAVTLAENYGEDSYKAAVAGLLHDCAKDLKDDETLEYCRVNSIELSEVEKKQVYLLHSEVGAIIAREKYGVEDESILNAIKHHSTGCSNMSMLDKIIFLADYIESGRTHSEVQVTRDLAYRDLDMALISAFDSTIKYIIQQQDLIHPNTIEARNNILLLISQQKEYGKG